MVLTYSVDWEHVFCFDGILRPYVSRKSESLIIEYKRHSSFDVFSDRQPSVSITTALLCVRDLGSQILEPGAWIGCDAHPIYHDLSYRYEGDLHA